MLGLRFRWFHHPTPMSSLWILSRNGEVFVMAGKQNKVIALGFQAPHGHRACPEVRSKVTYETEPPDHFEDTPKGYPLLTLLTNRRNQKW